MENREIKGSQTVSRHQVVGGNSSVGGSLVVGHNLIVKGWVDAPNIKYPCKGLYATEEELRKAHPRPLPGWFALIGDTLPAQIWVSVKGEWVWSGKSGGDFKINIENPEEFQELQEKLSTLEIQLSDEGKAREDFDNYISEVFSNLLSDFENTQKATSDHSRQIDQLFEIAGGVQDDIENLDQETKEIKEATKRVSETTEVLKSNQESYNNYYTQRFNTIDEKINSVLGEVYLDDIDNYFSGDINDYVNHDGAGSYKVVNRESGKIMGLIDVMTDAHASVLVLILTTSCVVKGTGVDASLHNYYPKTYCRHRNTSGWTDWEPIWERDIENLHTEIQRLVKVLDAEEYKTLSENNMIDNGQIYFVR